MIRKLIAAAALSFVLMMPAFAEEVRVVHTISLGGHGEVRVTPDTAIVTVGVLSQAATARDALTANSQAMRSIFAALKAAGIEAKDIQTSNFSVQPRYDYGDNTQPPKLVGYDVSNNVTVTVRKIDTLGATLDTLVSAGSNQINGISFQVAKPDDGLDEARKLAVADAARKAQVYAGAAQIQLGDVVSISEGTPFQPPVVMQAKTMRADIAAVPIAEGQQTISADVNIIWEIKQK
jgi:uncharacterized protein